MLGGRRDDTAAENTILQAFLDSVIILLYN